MESVFRQRLHDVTTQSSSAVKYHDYPRTWRCIDLLVIVGLQIGFRPKIAAVKLFENRKVRLAISHQRKTQILASQRQRGGQTLQPKKNMNTE